MKTHPENPTDIRKRLDDFMEEASRRVESWPDWKRNVGMMDKDRQYNRYEPVPLYEKKGE